VEQSTSVSLSHQSQVLDRVRHNPLDRIDAAAVDAVVRRLVTKDADRDDIDVAPFGSAI
jgi:hypothetical protein